MEILRLSDNFFLHEFTRSETAVRLGREIVVERDTAVYRDLRRLCSYILQPMREALGPVHVTSGYRPTWLNRRIGGSKRSQHCKGQAADLVVSGHAPFEVCAWLIESTLPFDQLIHEFGQWTHVSIAPIDRGPRREVLTAYKRASRIPGRRARTIYVPGLHRIADLQQAA